MRILEIRAMRGPNYWSVRRHKLIVMTLDLEELEEYPTNKIDGFYDRLTAMFPSMYEHRCSVGKPGGFFQRVEEGTWMGHVIEHIALEIQTLQEWMSVLVEPEVMARMAFTMLYLLIWKKK